MPRYANTARCNGHAAEDADPKPRNTLRIVARAVRFVLSVAQQMYRPLVHWPLADRHDQLGM
jgi:hypothetical protein